MEAKITDTKLFRMPFQYVARFIEVAHFDIKKDMMRVRSIDPHDFCYVDITLYPDFFENYVVEKEWGFAIESSKLTSILPTLTAEQIFMKIGEGLVNFSTKENWVTAFRVKWLRSDPYGLPEPNVLEYEAVANIPAKELSDIIQKASTISHEVSFSADSPNKLMVLAIKENYSFTAQPITPHFQISVKQPVTVSIILEWVANSTGQRWRITFTGFIPDSDLVALTKSADVLVVPSVYESFGIVALEGMAAGVPVVASQVGGLTEFIEHDKTGVLTYPRNPESIAWGIDHVFSNPEHTRWLVQNAREAVHKAYSWEAIAKRTVKIYREVTERKEQT